MLNPIEEGNKNIRIPAEHGHSVIDIREQQQFVCNQFLQFFTDRGYQFVPSEGLLPSEDTSVIFTGATITALKKYIHTGVSSPGYCMIQKCLRTKRLNELYDLTVYPDWTHYFTMCGILASPERLNDVSQEAYELLINRLNISRENILVQASSEDRDLSEYWRNNGIIIQEDHEPKNYFRWKYGIPNIYGRGINIQLRFNENDVFRDLGNIISIHDAEGCIRAYEFGFGLESLLSKLYGYKKPMEVSIMSTVIPYGEGLQEKFIDALVAAIVIYHHGIEPGTGKEKHVLKKIVKGLSFLRRKIGISLELIREYGNAFEQTEFITSNNSGDKLIAGIRTYEDQLNKFIQYAENQVHAHILRHDISDKLPEKLKEQAACMGISPVETEEVISSVLAGLSLPKQP